MCFEGEFWNAFKWGTYFKVNNRKWYRCIVRGSRTKGNPFSLVLLFLHLFLLLALIWLSWRLRYAFITLFPPRQPRSHGENFHKKKLFYSFIRNISVLFWNLLGFVQSWKLFSRFYDLSNFFTMLSSFKYVSRLLKSWRMGALKWALCVNSPGIVLYDN